MGKDELVHEIGAMLSQDPKIASEPWQHLVIVAQIREGHTKVNGFTYRDRGEAVPTSPSNFDVPDKFEALREAMREPGKELWKAALVRIDKSTRRISIDFEYDHPEKWLISPATVKKMAETLRPTQE